MKPFCITFAGPAGCSKSPVAQYLSCQLNVPVMSNDVIRTEVREDHMGAVLDQKDYTRRVVERVKDLAARKVSFIYDASNDRKWLRFLENFEPDSYVIGVISYDLSPAFYKAMLAAKQYCEILDGADNYLAQHKAFIEKHPDVVICSITDHNFPDRLDIALRASQQFIDDRTAKLR